MIGATDQQEKHPDPSEWLLDGSEVRLSDNDADKVPRGAALLRERGGDPRGKSSGNTLRDRNSNRVTYPPISLARHLQENDTIVSTSTYLRLRNEPRTQSMDDRDVYLPISRNPEADGNSDVEGNEKYSGEVTRDAYLRLFQFRIVPFHEKPRARQSYNANGKIERAWYLRSSTTFDLMLDIFYGCLFMQMSRAFYESLSMEHDTLNRAIRAFAAMAIPVFFQWRETTEYLNRFDAEDCVHLLYFMFNVGAVCYLGLHLEDCSSFHYSSSCSGVTLAMGGLRLGVAIMQVYAAAFNDKTKWFIMIRALRNTIVGIAWMSLAMFLPWDCNGLRDQTSVQEWSCCPWVNTDTWPMWWSILYVEVLLVVVLRGVLETCFENAQKVPLDRDLVAERMGTMVTIAITMTVVMCTFNDKMSYLQPFKPEPPLEVYPSRFQQETNTPPWIPPGPSHDHDEPDAHAFLETILVSVLAVSLKVAYFNLDDPPIPSRSKENGARHALTRSWLVQVLWSYLHLPLIMCICILGTALFEQVQEHTLNDTFRYVMVGALSAANAIMTMHQLLHVGGGNLTKRRWRKRTRIVVRFTLSLVLLAIPIVGKQTDFDGDMFIFVTNLCMVLNIVICLFGRQPLETSAALSGLSSAMTESLLAEQLLSAPASSRGNVQALLSRGLSDGRAISLPISGLSGRLGSNERTTLTRSDVASVTMENADLKRRLLSLQQKQWAVEKERDVARRRDRESMLTISQLRLKLRETMRELDERPPPRYSLSANRGQDGNYESIADAMDLAARAASMSSTNGTEGAKRVDS